MSLRANAGVQPAHVLLERAHSLTLGRDSGVENATPHARPVPTPHLRQLWFASLFRSELRAPRAVAARVRSVDWSAKDANRVRIPIRRGADSVTPLFVQAGATTALVVDNATPVAGQPVAFTATVTPQAPGAGVPTGAMTFTDSAGVLCSTLVDGSGRASCTTTYSAAGSDTVRGAYAGDANCTASTSSGQIEAIGAATTSVALTADTSRSVVGQSDLPPVVVAIAIEMEP